MMNGTAHTYKSNIFGPWRPHSFISLCVKGKVITLSCSNSSLWKLPSSQETYCIGKYDIYYPCPHFAKYISFIQIRWVCCKVSNKCRVKYAVILYDFTLHFMNVIASEDVLIGKLCLCPLWHLKGIIKQWSTGGSML